MIDAIKKFLLRIYLWSEQSTNKKIFYAALIVSIYSFVVKLCSAVKEITIAHQFGIADVLDSYLIAYVVPAFVINVIAGSFSSAFIPTFIKVRELEGQAAAQRLFSTVIFWSVVLLTLASLLVGFIIPYLLPLLASGFNADKLAFTVKIFYALMPLMLITGLTTLASSVLNAGERYAAAAIIPIATPIFTILFLLAFSNQLGVYTLVCGAVLGAACELILLGYILRKHGYFLLPKYYQLDQHSKAVIRQYMPTVVSGSLMCGIGLVDQTMAAMLNSGSVSVYNYGTRTTAVCAGFAANAISVAILPYFSKMLARNEFKRVVNSLKTYMLLITIIAIPLVIIIYWQSENLIQLIFQRGAFSATDTKLVAQVQALNILQFPFYVIGMMLMQLIASLRKNIYLLYGAMIYLPANIILNLIFMHWLGVAGIALATSVVYVIAMCYLLLVFRFCLCRDLLISVKPLTENN